MKPTRNLRWLAVGMVLFLSLSTFLNLLLPAPVRSQSAVELAQANRLQLLAQGDQLWQEGNQEQAMAYYRQAKPSFPTPTRNSTVPEPIFEIEQLGGGQRLWENALDGITRDLDSKKFLYLQRLIKDYPQFIPAHLKLAEACLEDEEACERYLKDIDPTEIMEQVSELYPAEPEVIRTKVKILAAKKKYLEASIAARQFALILVDHPDAPEFAEMADEYMGRFLSDVKAQMIALGILQAITGGFGISQGDWAQGVSAINMIGLLLKGESAFGEQLANAEVEKLRSQGKLVENPELLNYIKGIGGRLEPYMGRDFDYEYYVVKDPDLNAFTFPGGKIFINTGAIKAINTQAELAGLIGHEIAHSVFSHTYETMVEEIVFQVIKDLLPKNTPISLDQILELGSKANSRAQEQQADILGTRVLNPAGYAADGLRNFMAIMAQREGNRATSWSDTHPASAERVTYLEKLIVDNDYNRYAYEGVSEHREINQII
ncbi:M48 family metalloprotease [Oscillatoria salina]|uniref:M48 family metalloprotease n=1 Tax=Oscillatoria salina TaxID=331517 RepID=UPI001CCF287D|nr:M48 family metalloprotease [Oscillatoria salina]MBZ8181189.1 M48 family metalloprotease [Oscillatoria salina IIICB1]